MALTNKQTNRQTLLKTCHLRYRCAAGNDNIGVIASVIARIHRQSSFDECKQRIAKRLPIVRPSQ